MKRALLIYNPAAGGRADTAKRAGRLARRLEAAGFMVVAEQTRAPGHAQELARGVRDKIDAVFAYGGDGTLRECAAGLVGCETPLGFLPGGTANVMARVIGLPPDALQAADLLSSGKTTAIDVGLCGDRPLLMQASAGLDAEVLSRLDATRKRWLGRLEVALELLPAWWSFRYPPFEVRFENQRRRVTFAAVCNIPFYGGPFRMADASWDDRHLDLVLFSGRGRKATLGFTRDLLLGRHRERLDIEVARVDEVAISAADGLTLQIDGDPIPDALPARVHLAEDQIRLLIPS